MAALAAKLCLASLALLRPVVVAEPLSLDEAVLIQKEVHGVAGGQPKLAPFEALANIHLHSLSGFQFPSIPGMEGGEQPSMQDVMKVLSAIGKALKNKTILDVVVGSLDNITHIVEDSVSDMHERYVVFNASVQAAAQEDLVNITAKFLGDELDSLKLPIHKTVKSIVKMIHGISWGNHSRQVKLVTAMVEPLWQQQWELATQPLKDGLKAAANESSEAFCSSIMPFVDNATKAAQDMKDDQVQIEQIKTQLPMIAMMMGEAAQEFSTVGNKLLDVTVASLGSWEAQATHVSTIVRAALEDKVECDEILKTTKIVDRSGAPGAGLAGLAAAAALAAWTMAL